MSIKKTSFRAQKMGEVLRQEISQIFWSLWLSQDEPLSGGGIKSFQDLGVLITRVEVSRDLSLASIYVVFPDLVGKKEMLSLLNRNMKKIRFELVQKINMRYAPNLRFFFDDLPEKQKNLEGIFDLISSSQGV